MREPIDTIREFVATFVSAWPDHDAARLGRFFASDAVYHNMPMQPVHGREAIVAALGAFMDLGGRVEVDMVNVAAAGPAVLTERVDHLITPERTVSLPVMGVFEVHGGEITAWRDYFDPAQFIAGDQPRL